jgi:hypothetical protein
MTAPKHLVEVLRLRGVRSRAKVDWSKFAMMQVPTLTHRAACACTPDVHLGPPRDERPT